MSERRATALLYCHDTFGLGHLRRTLSVVAALAQRCPELTHVVATGSPLAHAFRLPERVDYVKLPSVVKTAAGEYAPRSLAVAPTDVAELRSDILTAVARRLRPELVLVDNVPPGLGGELLSALKELRCGGRTRLVLGLRDVVDEPERVRRAWTRDGSYELLDDLYDRILVYGQRDVYDLATEYGFSAAAQAKTRYVGYLRRGEPKQRRRRRPVRVLVTAGGGGDGFPLLRTAVESRALTGRAAEHWLVVTGPFLPAEERRALERLAGRAPGLELLEFTRGLPALVATADVVVSMGGYNSICEILSAGRPAVIVPRVEPRLEQLIRARALEQRGLVRVVHPDDLAPKTLTEAIDALAAQGAPGAEGVDLSGLDNATAELEALLYGAEPVARAAG